MNTPYGTTHIIIAGDVAAEMTELARHISATRSFRARATALIMSSRSACTGK
ncbi:hypothetical protein [Paenibacillus typhae]|uniref:hypothetical protein n=1 Tax=Paenibacillus typhae TaxID=1174501 RepID=UPI001C8D8FFF|nr:hypothetical protein [Paenibacillus typhae]MBY0012985.1 hypothetical protein [Paenibacillus typhae]